MSIEACAITHQGSTISNRWVVHNFRTLLQQAQQKAREAHWQNSLEFEFPTSSISEHTVWSDANFLFRWHSQGIWSNIAHNWNLCITLIDGQDDDNVKASLTLLWNEHFIPAEIEHSPGLEWRLCVENPCGVVRRTVDCGHHHFYPHSPSKSIALASRLDLLDEAASLLANGGQDLVLSCHMFPP